MGSLLLVSAALTLGGDLSLADLSESELAVRAGAEVAAGLSERENEVKARPHFHEAALCYEAIQSRNVRNAALYRNLGNAHFLAGELPQAILAYRRGLKIRPGDEELRTALAAARQRVYLPADGTIGRPPEEESSIWLRLLSSKWTLGIPATSYFLACLTATRWWMTRSRWILAFAILFFLASIAGTGLVWYQANRLADERAHPLVVIRSAQVKLLQGNGSDYPSRYANAARPGVEGRLLFERDGWMQIELGGGEVGWVAAEQVIVDRD